VRIFLPIFIGLLSISSVKGEDQVLSLNLQLHYDFSRDCITTTEEFFATDVLGYTFAFMDINFDRYQKEGGASDFYFEVMRYFRIFGWKEKNIYLTIQYDDGTAPICNVWLAGINVGNIKVGSFDFSSEFLLKKDYQLDVNWQYTMVWYASFFEGKLIFNGFLDYWANDVNNSNWPSSDPEIAATKYSFQSEPQVGWMLSSHWKIGSEVEISRGFLGSVTGKLYQEEEYKHDKWYFLPTIFLQYNF
jgi:hypothetical protein